MLWQITLCVPQFDEHIQNDDYVSKNDTGYLSVMIGLAGSTPNDGRIHSKPMAVYHVGSSV